MTEIEEKFKNLLAQTVEMFSINGPFVASRKSSDPGQDLGLVFSFNKMVSNLSHEEKMYLFHGVIVYLIMLVYEYNDKYNGNEMPTACILAEKMVYDLDDTCRRLFNTSLEKTLIAALFAPTMYSPGAKSESGDVKTYEILMTADAVNRREGD